MPLPKRPGPYILLLLLAVLMAMTLWLLRAVTAPEVREAVRQRKSLQDAPPKPATPSPGNSGAFVP